MLCIRLLDKVNEVVFCYISTLKLSGKSKFSHEQCRRNVDPPYFKIKNVDVMWSNVDVMWMEHCGILCVFCGEIGMLCGTLWRNVDLLWMLCGTLLRNVDVLWRKVDGMWTLHISTFHNLTKSSPLLGRSS